MKKKIFCIMGTRPEVIKLAPVVFEFRKHPGFDCKICVTSQHREMQDQMLCRFGLTADVDLAVMKPNQDLFYLTSQVLMNLQGVFQTEKPDAVLVQGDTTTSFAAALAAFYLNIPVGHVEAGLRTYQLQAPFPEEANRQLTARLARWHFAPTETAASHLRSEAVHPNFIWVTGNTVIDALLWMRSHLNQAEIQKKIPAVMRERIEKNIPFVLITGHRRESFGEAFLSICKAIRSLAEKYPAWFFVYPVHLNPNVQKPVFEILQGLANVHLIDPVEYETFVYLMDHCKVVLTDSGGVQEEAPALGKPVLVMREVTERPEGIAAGTAKLVGTQKETIIQAVSKLIDDPISYKKMANAVNPYGDGRAAERIVDIVRGFWSRSNI